METDKPIYISLEEVLRDKLGRKSRLVPGFVVNKLKSFICQDRMNALLKECFPSEGADFCHKVLGSLNIAVKLVGKTKFPHEGRAIFVCNHPLGGLDGMVLIALLSSIYPGTTVRFVVNDLLMAIRPLAKVFIPVNKHGGQNKSTISALDEVLAGDAPVIIFPAGLVSRRNRKGKIEDLEWKKMFIAKARAFRRDIIPMYFHGHNTDFFYNFARLREKSGLRFNIEMIRLPSEVFRSGNSTFTVVCGDTLHWQELGIPTVQLASQIKSKVYALAAECSGDGELINFSKGNPNIDEPTDN